MTGIAKTRKTGRRRLHAAAIVLIAAVVATGWRPALLAIDATSAEAAALASDLSSMVSVSGWLNDSWGVIVVSLDHGDTLFAHRPDASLAPASNLKLFTSAAALYYLGPDYRYGTYLATNAPVESGVLHGDLHLYGTGDPTLARRIGVGGMATWEAFADTLAALGVREVRGDIVGDGSYFEGPATGNGWHTSYINAWYAAPAGALSFHENIATLRITPADEAGWRPDVLTVPGAQGVAIVNLGTTVPGSGSRLHVTRAAYDGPIVIRGEIGVGARAHWSGVPVPDPARFAAAVFREVLEDAGIRVTGSVRAVHDPAQSLFASRRVFAPGYVTEPPVRVIAVHQSPALHDILSVLNKRSHNMYAEQVLRTVGRVVSGSGSTEGGEHAVRAMFEREVGTPPRTLSMQDGSGLSVLDQVSPRTTVELLSAISDTPMFDSYVSTLPQAGERGLRRMGGTEAQGNLHAKTGTINNVSALSGYVTAANGELLAFSIMSNDVPSTWRAKRVEDQIGARLAAFSRPTPPPQSRALAAADSAHPRTDRRVAPATTARSPATGAPESGRSETGESGRSETGAPANAAPEATTSPEPEAPSTHVIRSGDTLEGIARTYGTTVAALRQANPGVNPRRLIPGREVRLP